MSQNQIQAYDFTLEEVTKLFQMQDTLNSYIHPEWKTQGFDWGLAIVDECMEIHGHLGWKWWKKGYEEGLTESNRKQVQLEVIDILHFTVSAMFIEDKGLHVYSVWKQFNDLPGAGLNVQQETQELMKSAIQGNYGLLPNDWMWLAHSVGLTKFQILETYTQKYVLNKFRQDHGYKTGEYCKEWRFFNHGGEPDVRYLNGEDNYWLEQVVTKLRQGNHDTTDENLLYSELERLYNRRINQ